MKADYLVIGAMKCGTSTVCAYLEDHPDVFMVPRAEPNFFSHDDNFAKGEDWYHEFYSGKSSERLLGEGSNYYAARDLFPNTAERIAAYNPKTKLIYIVRDPIKRISSAWVQNRADMGDAVPPTVDAAVTERWNELVGQSLYWHNLQSFRAVFPDDQIFVGFMEDLSRDREGFIASICDFLGVEPTPVQRGHANPSAGKHIPGRAYTVLNSIPFMKQAKMLFPSSLRTAVKTHLLSHKVDKPPVLSPETKARVMQVVGPDASALLEHCGKPADYWTL